MEDPIEFPSQDRDQIIKTMIAQEVRHASSHLSNTNPNLKNARHYKYWNEQINERGYDYWSENVPVIEKDTRISLVIAPSWGTIFPPYNLARLSSVLRQNGYKVDVFDVNIESFHFVKQHNKKNFWDSIYYYSWEMPAYRDEIEPLIKPVLDKAIQSIIKKHTPVVGFSLYLTNILASMYMIKEIKRLSPETIIVAGGPEAFTDWFDAKLLDQGLDPTLIDFRIQGEGEQLILTLLEDLEKFPRHKIPKVLGGFKSKLNLDELPFPDYSDYNLSLYDYPDGTSIETSRGCVAKCSFCAETHFWKFRWTQADRTIAEMKHMISNYGIKRFWFVDSLANGNFKEFQKLVDLILSEDLKIRWNSYARNDGRMDLKMFEKIHQSGCTTLSFGVESGSQKVLDDMQKKIKIWEVEANLKDGKSVGMTNHVNWLIGFPTEHLNEFLHSLELLYNTRKHMHVISPGFTCGDAPFSSMNLEWKKYNLEWIEQAGDNKFLSNWWTTNYKNTILHRFIRLKLTNIWLKEIITQADGTVINAQYRPSLQKSYDVTYKNSSFIERIEQGIETFDYFKGSLSATLVNEYLPFIWVMYKTMGAYSITLKFSPEIDLPEFGTFVTNNYVSNVSATVNNVGILNFTCTHKFVHESLKEDPDVITHELVREDKSFKNETFTYNGHIDDICK
tara:strand:+ start:3 stop:2024 length:2022 start_codon:yes stop_codon:yes gene_type:complete